MKKATKKSWRWYSVVLLFESTISGASNQNKIDENFCTGVKLYEEAIVLIKAQSSNHAYKKANANAKKGEMNYQNPYDQIIHRKFIDSVNCQELFDNEIKSGSEVYSRLFEENSSMETKKFLEKYLPETQDSSEKPLYNFLIDKW